MKKVGSGQITITDLIDGELTVELSSNLSRVQIYSSSAGLSPDWTVENLKLTPTVRFNGKTIDISNKDLAITYLKKINSQSITKLDGTSELIDEGTKQLVVNQNNLNNENSENILYICAVTYKLNDNVFSAQASIMFSLLKNGQNGGDAYTVLLTNESHSFAGSETAALDSSTTTSIIGYKGSIEQNVKIKKVNNINASTSSISTGITGLNFKVSSLNFVKQPSITFYTTNQLITKSGTIPIVIEIDGKEFTKNFSFSVSYKGKQGEDASIVNLVASQQFFKSSDGNSFSPDIITITPDFQNCSFSNWYYSTNGGTSWIQITNTTSSSTDCYFDNTTKVLYIPKGFSKYNNSVTAIGFKCQSNIESVYDNITIAKIYDANSINIDSENYILNGGFYNAKNSWEATDTSSIITIDGKNWLRFYDNVGSTVTKVFRQSRSNIWATNPKQFVVSFDAQNVQVDSSVSTNYLWMMDITFIGNNLYKASKYVNLTSEKKHFTFKIETTIENITGFTIDCYALATNQKCDVRFTNLQLEIGNKETNWKPSSNDAFQVITKLQTKYDKKFYDTDGLMAIETKRIDTLNKALTDADGNIIDVSTEVDELTGRIETAEGLVKLSVTRENLAQGIKDGTALSLSPDMVKIAWNQVSSYWEFNGVGSERGLNLYYSGKRRIFNFNDEYLSFYDASATYDSDTSSYTAYDKLLSRFDRYNWIFYTGQESVSPTNETSKYKVCSIGRNYFQIFDGTSNSKKLATFDNNGIKYWYNEKVLSVFNSNGIQLNDANGNKKVSIDSSYVNMYGSTNTYPSLQISSSSMLLKNASNGNNLTKIDSNGAHFYRNGIEIGKVGINNFAGFPNSRGLVFDLEYTNQLYIAFAAKTSSTSEYITRLTWANFDALGGGDQGRWVFGAGVRFSYDIQVNGDFNVWTGNSINVNRNIQMNNCGIYNVGIGGNTVKIYGTDNKDIMHIYRDIDMHNWDIYNQSDGRLKTNIKVNKENALELFEKMRVRSFDWREDNRHINAGFIAQELKEINGSFVKKEKQFLANKEEIQVYSINQIGMIPYLVKAIQELYFIIKKNNLDVDINELITKQLSENINTYEAITLLKPEEEASILQEKYEEENF